MKTTIRDFVDGKADMAFAHYGVPKPLYVNETLAAIRKEKEEMEKVSKKKE